MLAKNLEKIEVGVHDGIEVVLGHNWGGPIADPAPRIAQVLTSTLALGGYSNDTSIVGACRPLLRAAYLGTLLAALALGKRRAVLTLIGGGAFGNPLEEIWSAIGWAVGEADRVARRSLEVVVNARESSPPEAIVAEVESRNGTVVSLAGEKPSHRGTMSTAAGTASSSRGKRPAAGEETPSRSTESPEPRLDERTLRVIQELFHGLIRARARAGELDVPAELPALAGLRATKREPAWFPVPGMYGGFRYWFEHRPDGPMLVTESWCRVAGGSGMRHEISPTEVRLIEQGFV
jgi:hypothetical protein